MASTDFEWSPEYCLSCDRQTTEGAYCSQACRLADLEKAGVSEPASPTTFYGSTSAPSSYISSSMATSSGFYLPPAVNFEVYKTTKSAPISPKDAPSQHSYFTTSQQPTAPDPSSRSSRSKGINLTPSSSRSSLSSVKSGSTSQGISDQALCQLREYANSFDQVRDMKRRLTLA